MEHFGMTAGGSSSPVRSLRRAVAFAFLPIAIVLAAASVGQVYFARIVHADLRRLFEEFREIVLARSLSDELAGVERWVEAAPEATPLTQPLVIADVRRHHSASEAAIQQFSNPDTPSHPRHEAAEAIRLERIAFLLRNAGEKLDRSSPLAVLTEDLRMARRETAALQRTIEDESGRVSERLDRRIANMTTFLAILGLLSLASLLPLGWLLVRRVLGPVRDLRDAAVRLGRGELDTPVPVQRSDELGDLAETFRTMAAGLRASRQELEDRVEQRSREVLRSAHLAQLGTLAAGIAHEINNPLASIVACTDGLLRELDRGGVDGSESTREYLQILRKEAMRARDITTRLLRFARQDSIRRVAIDLGEELAEVAALFGHQLSDTGVELNAKVEVNVPRISGDPSEWRQVIFNLLQNALDASPRGGRIDVSLTSTNGTVVLSVADNGPGIPEALRERIFEPFFTTKDPGRGTGLGLAIVHRIVTSHGGRVEVGRGHPGARFTIEVPAAS